jgi:hypothetical protein
LTEIESRDHLAAIAVAIRIGVHYGQITHYVNARGIQLPTGSELFTADEIAGDDHARARDSVIFTHKLADSLADGSVEAMQQAFEELPALPSGPAKGVRRFVKRPS